MGAPASGPKAAILGPLRDVAEGPEADIRYWSAVARDERLRGHRVQPPPSRTTSHRPRRCRTEAPWPFLA
jgi:hypothetical protein